jgi:hypothetical protein
MMPLLQKSYAIRQYRGLDWAEKSAAEKIHHEPRRKAPEYLRKLNFPKRPNRCSTRWRGGSQAPANGSLITLVVSDQVHTASASRTVAVNHTLAMLSPPVSLRDKPRPGASGVCLKKAVRLARERLLNGFLVRKDRSTFTA